MATGGRTIHALSRGLPTGLATLSALRDHPSTVHLSVSTRVYPPGPHHDDDDDGMRR